MALELSTPAPKAAPAIVSRVTQAPGESAIRTATVVFPVGFSYNEAFQPPRCPPEQERAEACPPGSRIGAVSGTSAVASASGDIFITDDLRLISFVRAAGGLVTFKVVGTITLDPSGGFAVTFSGTPNLPLRSFVLALEGGDRALVKNPASCGDYRFDATFTSYDGEVSKAAPAVSVTGCPPTLRVTAVRATAGRRGVRLRWSVSGGTEATRVVLRRRGRQVRARTVRGTALRVRSLRPGRYVAILRATAAGRTSGAKRVAFRVK